MLLTIYEQLLINYERYFLKRKISGPNNCSSTRRQGRDIIGQILACSSGTVLRKEYAVQLRVAITGI